MKTLVIIAHPNMENSVVNKKWKEEIEKYSDEITVHELYKEYPNEKLDIKKEQKLIEEAENIILQFPLYWFSCPPLLKKWFDEVWTYGWAYGVEKGSLENKKIGIALSTGGIKERYVDGGTDPYTIKELLSPFKASINHVKGINIPEFIQYGAMPGALSTEEIESSAKKYIEYIKNI